MSIMFNQICINEEIFTNIYIYIYIYNRALMHILILYTHWDIYSSPIFIYIEENIYVYKRVRV